MHSLKMTFGDISLDHRKMVATIDKRMQQNMREAARIFLRTVIALIPVWTGEAMGSLAPIAHELHVRIPSTPNPDAPFNGFSLGVGQAVSSEPFLKKEGWMYSWTIGTDVPHFQINTAYDVSKWGFKLRTQTPWKAFEAGRDAAMDYLIKKGPDFPNYTDFIVRG